MLIKCFNHKGYKALDFSTVEEMRPGDIAHAKVEGSFEKETKGEIYLV
jgi:hypothetical protein